MNKKNYANYTKGFEYAVLNPLSYIYSTKNKVKHSREGVN